MLSELSAVNEHELNTPSGSYHLGMTSTSHTGSATRGLAVFSKGNLFELQETHSLQRVPERREQGGLS